MLNWKYGIMLLFCRCQLRHIHHAYINIAIFDLCWRRWHGIGWISWSPTRYGRSLWLWIFILWKACWLLMNRGQLRWINDWIIQWRRYRYHHWWKPIALWLTLLEIKHQLSRVWWLPIPFGRGMINEIWVCGGVVCILFLLLMSNKGWEPTFLRDNCSHVWVSIPGIKLITSFLYQYNSN